jgi:predicted esterase YcpF (UPF0227 family)
MNNALLYLHGFNSSPASYKAQALLRYMREHGLEQQLSLPEIKPFPAEAYQQLLAEYTALSERFDNVTVVGSSLGGFYATVLAEHFGCRAVLINPAVKPHLLLEKYIGENVNYYSSVRWRLDPEHIEQLRSLDVAHITSPERYWLMLQTGDETLDYRAAETKYAACPTLIEQGGDHSFTGFEQHIPQLLEFCDIIDPTTSHPQ